MDKNPTVSLARASYLDTALARMKTGCRIEWRPPTETHFGNRWHVFDGKGVCWGVYRTKGEALAMYQLCCSLSDLPPSEHLYVPGHTGML